VTQRLQSFPIPSLYITIHSNSFERDISIPTLMDRRQIWPSDIIPYLMEYVLTPSHRRKYIYCIELGPISYLILGYAALVEHQGRANPHWHVIHYDWDTPKTTEIDSAAVN